MVEGTKNSAPNLIMVAELNTEDLCRIWETISENMYQISIPYIARSIMIESSQSMVESMPVQERIVDYGIVDNT